MKFDKFRRSTNVEDLTDPNKPVDPASNKSEVDPLGEQISRLSSQLAIDAGRDDVKKKRDA